MHKGQLKSWNDSKGFGFIQSESLGRDIFVHISALKSMSRKPKAGDIIYFSVERQPDGKDRATNCSIEGVLPLRTTHRKPLPIKKSKTVGKLTYVFVILAVVYGYQKLNSKTDNPISSPTIKPQIIEQRMPTYNFSCDGRQYCSHMTSREEAEFFIQNCPNTKMDGDGDGIPCENDSRF